MRIISIGVRVAIAATGIWMMSNWLSFIDTPETRYATYNHFRCFYSHTYTTSGDADIVVMGSSRLLTAFDAKTAQEYAAKQLGAETPIIVDIGRSWRGNGQLYRQVQDLLIHKKPKLLILEYNEDNGRNHGRFYEAAKNADIFQDISSRPSTPLPERLSLSMSEFLRKNVLRLSDVMIRPARLKHVQKRKLAKTRDCSGRGRDPVRLSMKQEKRYPDWQDNVRSWDVNATDEERNNYYLKKIISLAEEQKVKLVFVVVPIAFEAPIAPTIIQQFEQTYKQPILHVASTKKLEEIIKAGYSNRTHMALPGRITFTKWLIDTTNENGHLDHLSP